VRDSEDEVGYEISVCHCSASAVVSGLPFVCKKMIYDKDEESQQASVLYQWCES